MIVTSAEANKELKRYQEELSRILESEKERYVFVAATTEDTESARPGYDFDRMQDRICELQDKIRTIKHAINEFNVTHKPDGFDMTVDEMLVYIPQLSGMKAKYQQMAKRLPKSRKDNSYSRSSLIEYEYANYSIADAKVKLDETTAELTKAQLALDKLNTSVTFEINI